MTKPDDKPVAVISELKSSGKDAGWYYYDENYPDEGSVGPFGSRAEAAEHARGGGYQCEQEGPPTELGPEDRARLREEFGFALKLRHGDTSERLSVSLGEGLALLAMAERAVSEEVLLALKLMIVAGRKAAIFPAGVTSITPDAPAVPAGAARAELLREQRDAANEILRLLLKELGPLAEGKPHE